MTRNIFAEVESLPTDGAYLIHADGIQNYGDRWGYGYIVPLRPLKTSDYKRGTLFVVVNDIQDKDYLFANHVDDFQTATRILRESGQDAMWDLRMRRWTKP